MAEKRTNNEQQLFVQKEPFEYNGKTYNRYFIKGMVRGSVFGDADRADLIIEPFEITDDKTKQVIKGNRYLVRTVDEDGKVYECTVKPARTSDRSLLNMLLAE